MSPGCISKYVEIRKRAAQSPSRVCARELRPKGNDRLPGVSRLRQAREAGVKRRARRARTPGARADSRSLRFDYSASERAEASGRPLESGIMTAGETGEGLWNERTAQFALSADDGRPQQPWIAAGALWERLRRRHGRSPAAAVRSAALGQSISGIGFVRQIVERASPVGMNRPAADDDIIAAPRFSEAAWQTEGQQETYSTPRRRREIRAATYSMKSRRPKTNHRMKSRQ